MGNLPLNDAPHTMTPAQPMGQPPRSQPLPVRVGERVEADIEEGLEEKTVPKDKWDAEQHRSGQQDTLINAMIKVFAWLNGAVMAFVVLAWLGGLLGNKPPIITEHVVMSLIGATVIQAGAAFILITRYLFPSAESDRPK